MPRQIPQVAAPQKSGEGEVVDWTVVGGGAAAIVLVLLLLSSWRGRARPVAAPVSDTAMEEAETVMADDDVPSAMASRDVEAFYADPGSAPAPVVLPPPSLPEMPDTQDVNPVMELAEIMLSFGRTHGAAQTLQEFIEAHPKETLLPWMKLLEIYRSGDMRDEFDELAGKLHGNFNVEIQHWDLSAPPPPRAEDIAPKARTLEEAPHICEQVVATWGTPGCLDYLRHLLSDNRGGSRSGFTMPVVQEILLLIDILAARDAAATS